MKRQRAVVGRVTVPPGHDLAGVELVFRGEWDTVEQLQAEARAAILSGGAFVLHFQTGAAAQAQEVPDGS